MDGGTRHAGAVEVVRQLLAHALGAREHERLAVALLLHEASFVQDGLQLLVFVEALDHADLLDHILVRLQFISVSDHDLEGLVQDLRGEFSDLPGPGRREKQRLALFVYLGQNLSDLGLEAHVQHAVCLVQAEVRHTLEIRDACLQEIQQPPRRGDDDLDATAEVRGLAVAADTAVAGRAADARSPSELHHFGLDLHDQLASRCHDQRHGAVAGPEGRLRAEVH
mmetsp:Transcript_17158/g.43161  ORF Transcript_17158/g.43161 Transcript_17158/m.43161 type:complete len:224 (+) Transcript_17158:481-1152(+)